MIRRCLSALLSLAMLPGCGSDDAPKQAGVSLALRYPVLLIGQASLDVRDTKEALISIRGDSMLNPVERVIVDSDGRLFNVKRAAPIAGQRSIMWDMGTSARLYYIELAEQRRPSWPAVQELVIEQLRAPTGTWRGDERAIARVKAMRDVRELIEASRDAWNWAR